MGKHAQFLSENIYILLSFWKDIFAEHIIPNQQVFVPVQGTTSPWSSCFHEKSGYQFNCHSFGGYPFPNLALFKILSLPLVFLYDVQDVGSELILLLCEFTKL